jgi:hypothetical protein
VFGWWVAWRRRLTITFAVAKVAADPSRRPYSPGALSRGLRFRFFRALFFEDGLAFRNH